MVVNIALDFETYLIDENYPYPKPVCLSYYDGTEKGVLVGEDMEKYLRRVLSNDNALFIAHNITFECGVIYNWMPSLRSLMWEAARKGRLYCTLIGEQIIDLKRPAPKYKYALSDLVYKYFNVDLSTDKTDPKGWRMRYKELENVPLSTWPTAATEYAIMDSVWAHNLYSKQLKENVDVKRSVRAAIALNLMGTRGMRVDVDRVLQLESEIYRALAPKYKYLLDLGYCTAVYGSERPKKNIKLLTSLVKEVVKRPVCTAKGNIQVNKESLTAYYTETNHPVFKCFLDINVYDKVLTAYCANMKSALIRTNYDVVKSTGRTSSKGTSLYTSLNIQQMPRKVPDVSWDVRNCFIPRDGFKIVSIDYAGLELASAAHQLKNVFQTSQLADMINSGEVPTDLHSMFAAETVSIKTRKKMTYEDFLKVKKDSDFAPYRQTGKVINLGFPGGIGFETIRTQLFNEGILPRFNIIVTSSCEYDLHALLRAEKLTDRSFRVARLSKNEWAIVDDEVVELKNVFMALYPELKQFLLYEHRKYRTGKSKNTLNEYNEWEQEDLYQYKVHDIIRNNCTYTAFCNGYLMQTPSAIGATNMAATVIETYLEHDEVRPLAFIPDEMLFEIKDNENLKGHIKTLSEMMIDEMQKVLYNVRITVEAASMSHWSKAGEEYSVVYWKNINDSTLRS